MRIFAVFSFLVSLIIFASLRSSAVTLEKPSTLADQRQINVTIYNSNLALIHDRRLSVYRFIGGGALAAIFSCTFESGCCKSPVSQLLASLPMLRA